jgi:hypothetical protein
MTFDPAWSPPDTRVYVFNSATWALITYATVAEAIEQTPGINIVEKDTFFFAADGSPLEAHFLKPAHFHSDGKTYTDGVYSLPAGTGRTLQDWLFG